MSDSASGGTVPPVDTFQLTDQGMTAWKAVFDRLTVERLPAGMRSLKVTANSVAVYERVLTAQEARHLAELLTEPAKPPLSD